MEQDGFTSNRPRRSYGYDSEQSFDQGMGESVSRGRRPGQAAPSVATADAGGRPQTMGPAGDVGPLTIAPPANDLAVLLHRYGHRPSKNRPNGPMPDLRPGRPEFNPFERGGGKWIE